MTVQWRILSLAPGAVVSPAELIGHFQPESSQPAAVALLSARPATAGDAESAELILRVGTCAGLTALLLDGRAEGWILGLAAAVDLLYATGSSSFSAEGAGVETGFVTAELLGRTIGKARAIEVLIAGELGAERMLEHGMVSGLVGDEELADPGAFLEGLLPRRVVETVPRLKRTWAGQSGRQVEELLAVERLEFQRCFREGAAESIARYLGKQKRN